MINLLGVLPAVVSMLREAAAGTCDRSQVGGVEGGICRRSCTTSAAALSPFHTLLSFKKRPDFLSDLCPQPAARGPNAARCRTTQSTDKQPDLVWFAIVRLAVRTTPLQVSTSANAGTPVLQWLFSCWMTLDQLFFVFQIHFVGV